MNIVRELRKKKGIQQKELAIEIGVSNPTVSDWEHNRKDPSGERLKKLSEFFGVDELVILGKGVQEQPLFVPEDPKECGKSETDQIIERLLQRLGEQPKTSEARILASGIDKLPQQEREQALAVVRAMFAQYADYFEKEEADDSKA